MATRPSRALLYQTSAAAAVAAASARLAQDDARLARLERDVVAEAGFLGEMRAYREIAKQLCAICREASRRSA